MATKAEKARDEALKQVKRLDREVFWEREKAVSPAEKVASWTHLHRCRAKDHNEDCGWAYNSWENRKTIETFSTDHVRQRYLFWARELLKSIPDQDPHLACDIIDMWLSHPL
jgi:hypothetical protein